MGAGAVRAQQESSPPASSASHSHYHIRNTGTSFSSSNNSSSHGISNSTSNMKCEGCTHSFTLFRRKKVCGACGRHFCTRCLQEDKQKPKSSGRQCNKCAILASGHFTPSEIALWRIKDLRCFLDHNNVATSMCREKQDLVDLLVFHFKKSGADSNMEHQVSSSAERFPLAQTSPTASLTSASQRTPLLGREVGLETQREGARGGGQGGEEADRQDGMELSAQVQDEGGADDTDMPVDMLAAMGVSADTYSSQTQPEGQPSLPSSISCPAPSQNSLSVQTSDSYEAQHSPQSPGQEEFQASKLKRPNRLHLEDIHDVDIIEDLTIKQLKEILVNNFVNFRGCCEKWELTDRVKRLWQAKQDNKEKDVKTLDLDHPDLCKVCMDAVVDCVLLECGHMVTCTRCGKQLTECPICRQCIVRAVHIFRS